MCEQPPRELTEEEKSKGYYWMLIEEEWMLLINFEDAQKLED